ncbi:uncharacterized protein LOC117321773 [Pecten maximus]|uniref:uncharacterized protein LOC117321773 n=1 Tax=Pecten maximus TaxID=6579 RepID=UPI001458BC51|nr:uncharacterized protein LOC117321773 [Pecten maximus]
MVVSIRPTHSNNDDNGCSAILFSTIPLLGSVLFAVAVMSRAPVTMATYMMMVVGYGILAFADGSLRFVKARVVSHCFPDSTFTGLAFSSFGYSGQALSLYLTPYIAKTVSPVVAAWAATVACGIGVLCAVGLTILLQHQTPQISKDSGNKLLTLSELRALPEPYWWYILVIAFTPVCWVVKQTNLPDYLQLRHGYTMAEASQVTSLPPLIVLLTPLLCVIMQKIDCDGIVFTVSTAWVVPLYTLLGFCPAVNVYILALADGIGVAISGVLVWRLLLLLSPASHVGTLAGLMYLLRNMSISGTSVATGYILKRQKVTDLDEALKGYQHFFIMLIIMSSTGVLCGVVMNVLDFQKGCTLNSRIKRWRQSSDEAIELMSTMPSSNNYCGVDDANGDEVNEETSY